MSFFKGFASLFSWMDCFNNLSAEGRIDEILDNFYSDHPDIERNDLKALENDSIKIFQDFYDLKK